MDILMSHDIAHSENKIKRTIDCDDLKQHII